MSRREHGESRALVRWLLAGACLCGCATTAAPTTREPGGSAATSPPVLAAPAGESVRDRLFAADPADVAIFSVPGGLVAVDPDGREVGRFEVGAVGTCYADAATDAIWITRATTGGAQELAVIDLRAGASAPTPAVAYGAVDRLMMTHAAGGFGLEDANFAGALRVAVEATPSLELATGSFEYLDDQLAEAASAVEAARLLAPELLGELGRRAEAAVAHLPALEPVVVQHPAIDPATLCPDDPSVCGSGLKLPGSDLAVVAVGFTCGDGCYQSSALFDQGSATFVDVLDPTQRATASADEVLFVPLYWSPPAGARIAGGRMVKGEQVVFESLDASACGWLSIESLALW